MPVPLPFAQRERKDWQDSFDLLNEKNVIVDRINAIPSIEETKNYLASLSSPVEQTEEERASIEKSKAEIRKILGIGE